MTVAEMLKVRTDYARSASHVSKELGDVVYDMCALIPELNPAKNRETVENCMAAAFLNGMQHAIECIAQSN